MFNESKKVSVSPGQPKTKGGAVQAYGGWKGVAHGEEENFITDSHIYKANKWQNYSFNFDLMTSKVNTSN